MREKICRDRQVRGKICLGRASQVGVRGGAEKSCHSRVGEASVTENAEKTYRRQIGQADVAEKSYRSRAG